MAYRCVGGNGEVLRIDDRWALSADNLQWIFIATLGLSMALSASGSHLDGHHGFIA
jgi:hypothetical protein